MVEKQNIEFNEKEFERMFTVIKESGVSINSDLLLMILGHIVTNTNKDSPEVKKFAEVIKEEGISTEQLIARVTLFTCNSVVMSLWNNFQEQFTKAYEENKKKREA